ncbi:MAG: CHASE3 domain-containing protein [Alphaproteobacteria bacterium]|nr:CHASE3 domain-containing protein [Alphaproteobacteria bacterium]
MPSNASLRRAITLSAIGLALLAALVAVTFWSAGQQERAFDWVSHTLQARDRIRSVFSQVRDAEASHRGYLLTGDEVYLARYRDAAKEIPASLSVLAETVRDNPAQVASLGRLRAAVDERLQVLERLAALRGAGDGPAALQVFIESGKEQTLTTIRDETEAMLSAEAALLATRRDETSSLTSRVRISLLVTFGLIALLGVSAMVEARRRLKETAKARDLLAEANARLHAEAASRAAAEAQLRQSQKMESLGQLTGGIAHDFNNMLSIVIGSLDLARRRLRSDPDKAEAAIGHALDGAQRAASLTSRLLAFSRQQPLAPTVSDVNKLVSAMSELLRRTLGEQVEIETVLAGGLWRVFADAPQIESAVLNLAVNARDAMPEGGKLTIETANAYLDDKYAAEHAEVSAGQYVMLSVSDTGTGMSAQTIERAFDPFYTTKGVGKGTGLGLSQVFGFVKQSGGHVKIYSELGQGTTVKIYLPRFAGEAAVAGETAPAAISRGTESILVVEDEDSVRRVTVDTLRELGYTVVHASGGTAALALFAQNNKIDLLFTDVVMPEMSGRALADEALKLRPDLKVLYATGYTRNAVVHNGMLDAGVAFMTKPFTMEQLAQKVRAVLDGGGINRT